MLTRLTDRIQCDEDGETIIARFGMWCITAELERRGRKWVVVQKNEEEKQFKTKSEAELYMREIFQNRRG